MENVVGIDELFSAEHMGKALATLVDINGLSLSLHALQGDFTDCPVSLEPIKRNAGMIQDGTVYQLGRIAEWVKANDRSPLTNLPMSHRNVLRVSSLTGVVTAFLDECRVRRDQTRRQRVRAARQTDRGSYEKLQQTLREVEVKLFANGSFAIMSKTRAHQ